MWNSVQLTSLFPSQSCFHPLTHKHILHSSISHIPLSTPSQIPFPINTTQHTLPPQSLQSSLSNHSSSHPCLALFLCVCVNHITPSIFTSNRTLPSSHHQTIHSFQSSHISCPKHNSFNPTHFDNHSHSLIKTTQQPSFPPSIPLFLHPPLFKHSFLNLFSSIILSITIISFLPFSPSPLIIPLFLCLSHLFIPTLIIPSFNNTLFHFCLSLSNQITFPIKHPNHSTTTCTDTNTNRQKVMKWK